jgi:hypothetical protein
MIGLPELAFIGRDTGMIAVVRADNLNLIQLQRAISCLRPNRRGIARQNGSKANGGSDAEAAQVQENIL